MGFGADQVILVRDEAVRKEISSYIGHQALILTIIECKGLEFQDVLLYNFFSSSHMCNQWRVVYQFMKERNLFDASSPESFPSFSQLRHNILCSELKQLYVAITRTRRRLWICENNEQNLKPMLNYWRQLCLVQVKKIDDSLAQAMQRASSPEEWRSQGIKLFWERNYEMATMCFAKAGEETWEKRAKASGLRAFAYNLIGSNSKEAHIMLREAAEIFNSIGKADSAAECFCDVGEYERAGRIYLEKCGVPELRKAGECFSLAGNYKVAAEAYAQGNFFIDCLSACSKGKLFDMGLQYIKSWKQEAALNSATMSCFKDINEIAQDFLEKCALECYARKDTAMLMDIVCAFRTMESKRIFLTSLDCLAELSILEEESGNFNEAADIVRRLGDIPREVYLLEKAGQFANASMLIISHVLCNSLWLSGSQCWPLKSFAKKEELLAKAMAIAQKVSESFHASICAEAKILSDEKRNLSELMHCFVSSKHCETLVGEILSIRKLLDALLQVNPANFEWESSIHLSPRILDGKLLKAQVSVATLMHAWNLWKVKSLEISRCLDSLGKLDFIRCEGVVRFCFCYFGVRLLNSTSGRCALMNPNAVWVRNVDKRFLMRGKNLASVDACHLAPAVRNQWDQELLSVGIGVLETLNMLYKLAVEKYLSSDHQSVCLTYIFDIVQFVKSLDSKNAFSRKLHDFLQLSLR